MPNARVRASATALPKIIRPIALDNRSPNLGTGKLAQVGPVSGDPDAPDPIRDFIDDPTAMPDQYAMYINGTCLDPVIKHGECVLIDKTQPYKPGDLVLIYRRREATPPGQFQSQLKRLIMKPPHWVKFPYREHPQSEIASLVIVEMINPQRQLAFRCGDILAIHKCLGPVPAGVLRVKAELPEGARRREL
jgi:hypothetical protein